MLGGDRLHLHKARISTVERQQFLMIAPLHNTTLAHNAYLSGISYGRQTVSNYESRAVLHQSFKSLLNKEFTF